MNPLTKPRKKGYQAVFFDLDGTLTDPQEGITRCIQFALNEIGFPCPAADQLIATIGFPLKEVFSKLTNSSCEILLNSALKYYRQRYAEQGMYENNVYPGVEKMLFKLCQKKHRLFVATSKPEVFAIQILKHFNLAQYFERIYGAEMDGTHSDKRQLLKHILESKAIQKPSLMVGDRNLDVIAAIENEIDALGVLYGYGSKEELIQAGANHLCTSPHQVYQWIH